VGSGRPPGDEPEGGVAESIAKKPGRDRDG
jgi:hypothetical protein